MKKYMEVVHVLNDCILLLILLPLPAKKHDYAYARDDDERTNEGTGKKENTYSEN